MQILYFSIIGLMSMSCKDNPGKLEPLNNHGHKAKTIIINDENIPYENKIFLEAESTVDNLDTQEKLNSFLTRKDLPVINYGLDHLPIRNGVQGWKITYQTKYKGKRIKASGLLLIPSNLDYSKKHSLVSVMHATITHDFQAPSNFPGEGLWEAGSGLVVGVPDYIGFGKSADIFHPFLIEEGYQESCADFITAIYWLTKNKLGLNLSKGLYIKGHSEGAYASISLQKYIEDKDTDGSKYNLKGVAASSGPYPVNGAATRILKKEVNPAPLLPPFLLIAYREHYNELKEVLSDKNCFANPKFNWKSKYSGKYTDVHLENKISTDNSQVFSILIYSELKNALLGERMDTIREESIPSLMAIMDKLNVNSLTKYNATWQPKTPYILMSCEEDPVVPILAQTTFLDRYPNNKRNFTSKDIPYYLETSEIHSNCPSIYETTRWIHNKIKNNR